MKLARQIKNKTIEAVRYVSEPGRLRHFRGRGIHSPFVYSMVRQALLNRDFAGGRTDLYERLRAEGVGKYYARQIQNLHSYCNYAGFGVTDGQSTHLPACEFVVVGSRTPDDIFTGALGSLPPELKALVVMAPRSGRRRRRFTENETSHGRCLTIDNRGYVVIFYDRAQPARHFKL